MLGVASMSLLRDAGYREYGKDDGEELAFG
jgi:hypothetical protein